MTRTSPIPRSRPASAETLLERLLGTNVRRERSWLPSVLVNVVQFDDRWTSAFHAQFLTRGMVAGS